MGCDIHAVLEFRPTIATLRKRHEHSIKLFEELRASIEAETGEKLTSKVIDEEHSLTDADLVKSYGQTWVSYTETQLRLGREYALFVTLAGVRGCCSDGMTPTAKGRGIPDDISYETKKEYLRHVVDDTSEDGGGMRTVSRVRAARWVDSGSSVYWHSDCDLVTNPDAHSESWCNAEELGLAIKNAKISVPPRYIATFAAMRALEEAGYEARLVFWFDN